MDENIFYDYSTLKSLIMQYSYAQITDFLGFTVVKENSLFTCLTNKGLNYVVFMDATTGLICLYDISNSSYVSKEQLFFSSYYSLEFSSLKKAISNFKVLNEFRFSSAKVLSHILTLYFGNANRSNYLETYQSFSSLCCHSWFDKSITFNKTTSMFTVPMFNNGNYALNNFIDFNESSFKLRYNTPFSMFYQAYPKEAYQQIETGEPDIFNLNSIRENQLIVCFNPLVLIEASPFYKINQINYFPVILEPNFTLLKFLTFTRLLNPLIFEKVEILYSLEKNFYYNDLLNACLFIIFSTNIFQSDFYFEYDISTTAVFTLIITRSKSDFKPYKFEDFLTELCDQLNDDYAGRKTPGFTNDVIQNNIEFLSHHGFTTELSRFDKSYIYYISFAFKVETAQIFCDWMLQRFLKNFNLRQISGLEVFNDKAF